MNRSIVVVVWRSSAWIRPWLFDGAVAAFVAALTLVDSGLPWPIETCGLLMALVLIWRRHIPVTVLAVVFLLAPLHLLMNSYVRLFDVAVLIAMYSVVLYKPQLRWGVVAGAGAGIGVLVAALVEHHRSGNFWVVFWVVGAVTVSTWVSAYGMRTRRLYVETLEERAATLERERDHLALLAAAEERAAIAREIHDVVAHSLSVMIVQADAAGFTLDGPKEPARQALETIASTGREALEDMRRVIKLLRGALPPPPDAGAGPATAGAGSPDKPLDGENPQGENAGREKLRWAKPRGEKPRAEQSTGSAFRWRRGGARQPVSDRAPVPRRGALDGLLAERGPVDDDDSGRRTIGLQEVDGLVARSGLRVTRETVGTPGRLSAAQEITAYRIIQESLTNTLRHAGTDAAVTLRLAYTPRGLRVEVSDNGGGRARIAKTSSARSGHGLVGMRERVAVHGGELVVGPRTEGGWQVVATIPRTAGSRV